MRYLLLLGVLIATLFSCRQEKLDDSRPQDQLDFIAKTMSLHRSLRGGYNEIRQDELLDSASKALNSYTIDTLNRSFNDWQAEIVEISNKPYGLDGVEVVAVVKRRLDDNEEQISLSSITFSSFVPTKSAEIVDSIRKLKVRDKVSVSGKFHYTTNMIKLSTNRFSPGEDYKISNPDIKVTLTSIHK